MLGKPFIEELLIPGVEAMPRPEAQLLTCDFSAAEKPPDQVGSFAKNKESGL